VSSLQDGDAARAAEVAPLVHELHVAIEDLHAVVRAVRHEQPPLRVERQRVRPHELARRGAHLAVRATNVPSVLKPHQRSPSCCASVGRGQWPSATMMSPFGAMAQAVGPMNVSVPAFDTPPCRATAAPCRRG
jgi:hypothetical protein